MPILNFRCSLHMKRYYQLACNDLGYGSLSKLVKDAINSYVKMRLGIERSAALIKIAEEE